MEHFRKILFMSLCGIILTAASCSIDNDKPESVEPPTVTHYTVKFGAGANWNNSQPITGQDLQDHSVYQFGLFNSGTLKMAGFLLETDEARYFQGVTTEDAIDQIITDDPAVIDGILAVEEKEAIAMIIEQIPDSAAQAGKSFFIVEYTPGTSWNNTKKLWEQDLTAHQNYIGTKFSEKFVLRGCQFLNIDKAMYIVIAPSIADVQEFINNDPAVTSQIFSGKIVPYTVNVEQL